jgi:hypothetical protein
MAVIRPPVTGDVVLDSYLDQVAQELSLATFSTAALEQSLLEVASNTFSATLFLYRRTGPDEIPDGIQTDLEYTYTNGRLTTTDNNQPLTEVDGWSFNVPPSVLDGDLIWQTYVHISSRLNRETIESDSWSVPELQSDSVGTSRIPTPSRPKNISITRTSASKANLSFDYDTADIEHPGLYAVVEVLYPGITGSVWETKAYLTYPSNTLDISDYTEIDTNISFRVKAGNVLVQEESDYSNVRTLTPLTPSIPNTLTVVREGDLATLSWEYTPNFAKLDFFEIQYAYSDGIYKRLQEVPGTNNSLIIEGIGSVTDTISYKIRAVGINERRSGFSSVVEVEPVIPNTPTDLDFLRVSKNEGSLSWVIVENDAVISHYDIEMSVGNEDNYTLIGSLGAPANTYRYSGLQTEDDELFFRITSVGMNRLSNGPSNSAQFIPGVPNAPINLAQEKLSKDQVKLSWEHNEGFTTTRNFIIEARQANTQSGYITVATVDGNDREFIVEGISVRSTVFEYRIKAVGLYGRTSNASASTLVSPSTPVAPTGLSLEAVENVGTVTSVKLTWTKPSDLYNQYSTITAQLKHESDNVWKDVAVVPAESTQVEFQPSRQGTLSFRLRSTAVNGISSEHSVERSIYIAGGSATDNAIYNGDSGFLSTKHYSVNTDDFELTLPGDVDIISGGTYDGVSNKITGQVDTDLVLHWYTNISFNMVNRQRHFYLNVNNVETVSTNPSPWTIDRNNVLVEVLTSSADTEDFYINDGTPLDNFIYVGSNETSSDIRTYSDREEGEFMYASRDYISLTMKRTFTFRQAANTLIKLTFRANKEAPVISLDSGSALKLEAFATELMDDIDDYSITASSSDPDGTLWEFSEDFEAAPKIFVTPNADTRVWVTDKSATSCRIHAADTCTVDATARGR